MSVDQGLINFLAKKAGVPGCGSWDNDDHEHDDLTGENAGKDWSMGLVINWGNTDLVTHMLPSV